MRCCGRALRCIAGHPWLDLDRRQLLATIRAFSQSITPGSVALIYYAGHGVRSGGRNFLVPANAAIPAHDEDYDRDLVAIDDMLLRPMQQANGALTIIVLDACEFSLWPVVVGATRCTVGVPAGLLR